MVFDAGASDAPSGGLWDDIQLLSVDGTGEGAQILAVFMGDDGLWSEDAYKLPTLLPSASSEKRITVQLGNLGGFPLQVTRIELLATNPDGTEANEDLKILWPDGFDPTLHFPVPINPHQLDQNAFFEFELLWTPVHASEADATLVIESNDPVSGNRQIRLVAPSFAAEPRVEPDEGIFWFATLADPEVLTFKVHNDGLSRVTVESVVVTGDRFQLLDPEVAGVVNPKSAPGYVPVSFRIRHQPVFGQAETTGVATVTTDAGVFNIPLTSKYETNPNASPCVWTVPGGGTTLDFHDVLTGTAQKTLVLKNVGTGSCDVNSAVVDNDPNGTHYGLIASFPGGEDAEGNPIPATPATLPVGVPAGSQLELQVVYTAGDAGYDGQLVISFNDPLPKTLELDLTGGTNKPCFEYVPTVDGAAWPLQFVGPPGAPITQSFVVHSCGSGTLTLNTLSVLDDVNPADASAYWSVTSPGAAGVKIAPGAYQVIDLTMALPGVDGTDIGGTLSMVWTTGVGQEIVTVPLTARADTTIALPSSNPQIAEAGPANVEVGTPVAVDGSGSVAGSADWAIGAEGYLWYLVSKPADSDLSFDAVWSGPTRFFVPDVVGSYVVALIVAQEAIDGTAPALTTVYSRPITLTVTSAEAMASE